MASVPVASINAFEAAQTAVMNAEAEPLHRAKVIGLLMGYHARWQNQPYVTMSTERFVECPVVNPATNAKSRTFKSGGKIDTIVQSGSEVLMVEHKTTSEDIEDPNSNYWRQLVVEQQASHYMLIEWLNGNKIDAAIYDVVRKPSIAPKQLSKADQSRLAADMRYFGHEVSREQVDAALEQGRETPELFALRLAYDCTEERPLRYFARRRIPRLDADLHEYAIEQWDLSQELLQARWNKRWPRNSGACMLYGGPCQFLGICSGFDQPDSGNWRLKKCVHNELEIGGDGRDLLTPSRLRCFQTCRQKHYLHYELGIERVDAEDKDSLVFGSLWHLAMEAWFKAFEQKEED